jgi:GTP cyclohydrolase II
MPDVLHWLGVRRIDRLVSMSNLKYDALKAAGIEVGTRVPIPPELIPPDASVEIAAKKAAGYFSLDETVQATADVTGRDLEDY